MEEGAIKPAQLRAAAENESRMMRFMLKMDGNKAMQDCV
jgi:hypothetical protein